MSGSPFTREESATILAGLRLRQQQLEGQVPGYAHFTAEDIDDIASDQGELTPLTAEEIDDLCMMVNTL